MLTAAISFIDKNSTPSEQAPAKQNHNIQDNCLIVNHVMYQLPNSVDSLGFVSTYKSMGVI